MEAVALHAFSATKHDELSFAKNEVIKISGAVDEHWYMAELRGIEGMVPKNYVDKKECSWFAGDISRQEAEMRLKDSKYEDGAFLIRKSQSAPQDFSLSVKFENEIQHFKILRDGAGKYFLWVVKFDSLNQLVEYHKTTSVTRDKPIIYLKDPNSDAKKNVHVVMKPNQPERLVKALYDFKPDPSCLDELRIQKGDLIVLIAEADKNWWKGRNKSTNKEGLFPANHVQKIS